MEKHAQVTVDPETARPVRPATRPATRTLVLNGALPGDETLAPVEDVLLALLRDVGSEVRSYSMRDVPLAYCQGCFECWTTLTRPVQDRRGCRARDRRRHDPE